MAGERIFLKKQKQNCLTLFLISIFPVATATNRSILTGTVFSTTFSTSCLSSSDSNLASFSITFVIM